MTKNTVKKLINCAIVFVVVPLVVALGVVLLDDRKYMLVAAAVALLACVPFFVAFERGRNTGRELVVLATMCALSVVGRLIFAPIPGFKPVTALVVISGIMLGPEAGFIVGSMTALVSNVFFGQGPWTPFQMFVWGLIGFVCGLVFFGRKRCSIVGLIAVGVLSGVGYSLLMDVWTTVSMSGEFVIGEYFLNVAAAVPFTVEYAVSNVIFLLVLYKPFEQKLARLKQKYNVFSPPPQAEAANAAPQPNPDPTPDNDVITSSVTAPTANVTPPATMPSNDELSLLKSQNSSPTPDNEPQN